MNRKLLEKLKLEYEHHRSWALADMAVVIACVFGLVTIPSHYIESGGIFFGLGFITFLIAAIVEMYKSQSKYKELIEYYEE